MFIVNGHNSIHVTNSLLYNNNSMLPPHQSQSVDVQQQQHIATADGEEEQHMFDEAVAKEEAVCLEGEMQYLQEQSSYNQEDNDTYAELCKEEAALEPT